MASPRPLATFRFYEELNDFLAPERRKREFTVPCARAATTKHMIEALGVPHTEVGAVPMTARGRVMQESFNQEIQFAGVQCHPGDLVIADGSGVVIIAKEKEQEVVAAAEAIYQKEQEMADGIRKGYSGLEMLEKLGYEQMLKKQ